MDGHSKGTLRNALLEILWLHTVTLHLLLQDHLFTMFGQGLLKFIFCLIMSVLLLLISDNFDHFFDIFVALQNKNYLFLFNQLLDSFRLDTLNNNLSDRVNEFIIKKSVLSVHAKTNDQVVAQDDFEELHRTIQVAHRVTRQHEGAPTDVAWLPALHVEGAS